VLLRAGYSRAGLLSIEKCGVIRSTSAPVVALLPSPPLAEAVSTSSTHPASLTRVHRGWFGGDVYVSHGRHPEGFTMFDVRARSKRPVWVQARNSSLAKSDTAFDCRPRSPGSALEGYLFPDTVSIQAHAEPAEIAAIMVKRFRQEAGAIGLNSTCTGSSPWRRSWRRKRLRRKAADGGQRLLQRLADIGLGADPSVIYAELLNGTYQGALIMTTCG